MNINDGELKFSGRVVMKTFIITLHVLRVSVVKTTINQLSLDFPGSSVVKTCKFEPGTNQEHAGHRVGKMHEKLGSIKLQRRHTTLGESAGVTSTINKRGMGFSLKWEHG
mgnify:CR=1 FL=1